MGIAGSLKKTTNKIVHNHLKTLEFSLLWSVFGFLFLATVYYLPVSELQNSTSTFHHLCGSACLILLILSKGLCPIMSFRPLAFQPEDRIPIMHSVLIIANVYQKFLARLLLPRLLRQQCPQKRLKFWALFKLQILDFGLSLFKNVSPPIINGIEGEKSP